MTTGSTTQTETYSWDLGQYVINAPTATTACANNATGLASCTMFTDVTGWTASTDPNFYRKSAYTGTDGTTSCTKTANTSVSTATSGVCAQYDAHYTVGNYYQWNAATAGTGGTIVYTNATGSICPKGWKLPDSGDTSSTMAKGSFMYLLSQYGVQSNATGSSNVSGTDGTLNAYDIALSPLFLVRGGYVNPSYAASNESFRFAGYEGYYWSSRAGSNASLAYVLYFTTSVAPSNGNSRYYGRSLRCLIPTP